MDPVSMDAGLASSALPMASVVAVAVQAFVRSGLPVRHSSLLALVLGIGLSVAVYAEFGGVLVVALMQGIVVGAGAYGGFAQFSKQINTNGDRHE